MKAKYFAALGVVVLVIIGALALQAGGRLPFLDEWLGNLNPFKPKPSIITISDAIITDITRVKQLTTTIYTAQQLAEKRHDRGTWDLPLSSYRMVMVMKGTVEAGLDLNQLHVSDVSMSEDGKTITVKLPAVMILTDPEYVLSNDDEDTYVFYQNIEIAALAEGVKGIDLENQLRSEAGANIIQAACKDGILTDATNNARDAIDRFLKTTQPNVNITVVSAEVPSVNDCMKMGTPSD